MKEFDIVDYYNNTLIKKEDKQYFRALVCKKFNVQIDTFNTWLRRGKCPTHYKNTIVDMINHNSKLPSYK